MERRKLRRNIRINRAKRNINKHEHRTTKTNILKKRKETREDKQKNNEATAQKVLIKTGKTQGDIIEVLAPLTSQVEYIQEGARTVHNGQKVKIVTQ